MGIVCDRHDPILIVNLLKNARSLLMQGWAKEALARDAEGNSVHPLSLKACSWCARGALTAASEEKRFAFDDAPTSFEDYTGPLPLAIIFLESQMEDDFGSLAYYNDKPYRTKEQIINLYDRAIASLESETML